MSKTQKTYEYCGPVYEYDRCIENCWKATTYAVSEKKALNNLAHRYKVDNLRGKAAKIKLPGEIKQVR